MKDAYYFPHDSNARQDPKIVALCSRYGLVAYACYFLTIEILREQVGYRLDEKLISALTTSWQSYGKAITNTTSSSILGDMFEFGLLERKDGFISSPSLINRMSHLDDIRRKRSEAGSKGAAKLWQSHGGAMAVKESKVNKRKDISVIKDITLPTPPKEIPETGETAPASKPLTDVQKVVVAFKMLQGFEKDDKAWDRLYFPRFSKSAAALLAFVGNWKDAVDCCQDIYEKLSSKGFTVTLETITKHAGDWLKDKREKEAGRGILSLPSNGSL